MMNDEVEVTSIRVLIDKTRERSVITLACKITMIMSLRFRRYFSMASRVSRLSSMRKREVVAAACDVVWSALDVTAAALGLPLLSDPV